MTRNPPKSGGGQYAPESALDVASAIVHHNDVSALHIFEYTEAPPLQELMEMTADRERRVERALEIRAEIGLSFTEAMMSTMIAGSVDPEILRVITRHFSPDFVRIEIDGDPGEIIRERIEARRGDHHVALSSRVEVDGKEMHIPMVDFRSKQSDHNQDLALEIIDAAQAPEGYFLRSGFSYHYYGLKVMKLSELWAFLGKVLMFSPAVDRGWIAHQMIQGACALRLTPREESGWPTKIARVK